MNNGESTLLRTLLSDGVPNIAMYNRETNFLSRRIECNGIDSSRELHESFDIKRFVTLSLERIYILFKS